MFVVKDHDDDDGDIFWDNESIPCEDTPDYSLFIIFGRYFTRYLKREIRFNLSYK